MTSSFFVKGQLDMKAFTMHLYACGIDAMHREQDSSVQRTLQKDSKFVLKEFGNPFLEKVAS